MKKILMAIVAVASVMLTACTVDQPQAPVNGGKTYKVVIDEATKTTLNLGGEVYKLSWVVGDNIAVTDGTSTAIYTVAQAQGGEATIVYASGDEPTGMATAYYPASILDGKLPYEQRYLEALGDVFESPMVGVVDGTTITFKNLCGVIKFSVTSSQTDVKLTSLQLTADQPMSGAFVVDDAATGTCHLTGATGTTMDVPNIELGTTPANFYFLVAPATYTNLKITAKAFDGRSQVLKMKADASLTVERSMVHEGHIELNNFIEPAGGTALLPPGQEFITAIKQLADPDAVYNSDVFITRISLNVNEPSTEGVVVSDLFSEVPVYAVYDDVTGRMDINTAAAEICTGEEASYMFSYLFQCEAIDNLSVLNTSAATTMFSMFNNYTDDSLVNEKICMTSLDVSHLNTENVTVFTNMFNNCRKLTSLDLSSFNTSNAQNMQYMFSRCESLESLDLSNFDTQNVVNFNYFVSRCLNLTSVDVSSFNTSAATTMIYMFSNCWSLTSLDVSNFDVSAVEADGLKYMFNHCESLTSIDVSNFNLENATSLAYFMAYMYSLESLDMSGLDTYNITDMQRIFAFQTGRTYIKLGGKFTTENCTTLYGMFNQNDSMVEFCADDLETSSCQQFLYMFSNCDVLQKLDLTNIDLASATSLNYMFTGDPNLTELRVGENFVHSKKPTNFFCGSTQEPGVRTSSNPGYLTIYCDQDQADWFASTILRYMYWGYYGETTSTAVIDGCPRITITFRDRDTGAEIGVDWPDPK
ncbi:MAG: BspA family leucine-rich repeat surface protein [Bacteroidales bacterium]|nr:BspA family leucine-rich repeat surface protein [Bacteroidales bacterium]